MLSREKVSISLDKDEKRDIPFHSHEVKVLFFGTYNHFLATWSHDVISFKANVNASATNSLILHRWCSGTRGE